MRALFSRLVPRDSSTALSVASLVFVVVLVGLFGLTALVQRNTNHRLDRTVGSLQATNLLVCDFIVADANTRRAQAQNSLKGQLKKDRALAANSGRLLPLFKKAEKSATRESRPGLLLFESYIRSSHEAAVARAATTTANVAASQVLAEKADELAARECPGR